jgi:MFS family permease
MIKIERNVLVLTLSGALGMCVAPMVVFIGGIIGTELAPEKQLATLPIAALVIGTALSVIPVTRLMHLIGRKKVFVLGALLNAAAALFASVAITHKSFWGFTLSVTLMGTGLAIVQQYRFAAMESVAATQVASAASFVLLGGLVAAYVGPELAHVGRDLLAGSFSGSFVLLALVCVISAGGLLFFQPPGHDHARAKNDQGRPLLTIARQPVFWAAVLSSAVGYAVMSYIMTATPVSMHMLYEHSLEDTKWVIQSHIVAMYLPSFFSGRLIAAYGEKRLMLVGLTIMVACLGVVLSGHQVGHFWLGLLLLGVGWNFLFVSGTALLHTTHKPEERFKVQGFNDFFVFGFQAIASLSSGVVIYGLGWEGLVMLASPLLGLQLMVIWIWQRRAVSYA